MNTEELYKKIEEKFPGSILEFDREAMQPWFGMNGEIFYEVCQYLRDDEEMDFDFLMSLSGVDYGEELGTVYHLYSMGKKHKVTLKVKVSRENPEIASVADLWRTADWHEREIYDLFGIVFKGHPDLRRMLLPEDWEGHPLRKDYVTPESYNGIPILHKDFKGDDNARK